MRKYLWIAIVGLLVSCSGNKYLLTDTNNDKQYLQTYIKEAKQQGEITKTPLLVIDGVPVDLKKTPLDISKAQIKTITSLKKDSQSAIDTYGEKAQDGVLLITTTNDTKRLKIVPLNKSNVLFILDGKPISQLEMNNVEANTIQSVEVIKNKETIKAYTSEDYDSVVLINTKK